MINPRQERAPERDLQISFCANLANYFRAEDIEPEVKIKNKRIDILIAESQRRHIPFRNEIKTPPRPIIIELKIKTSIAKIAEAIGQLFEYRNLYEEEKHSVASVILGLWADEYDEISNGNRKEPRHKILGLANIPIWTFYGTTLCQFNCRTNLHTSYYRSRGTAITYRGHNDERTEKRGEGLWTGRDYVHVPFEECRMAVSLLSDIIRINE